MVDVNGQDDLLRYTMVEESQPGTVLGNIAIDAGLDSKYGSNVLGQLRFIFHSATSQHIEYFQIDNSGQLQAAKPLDRDIICPSQEECDISLGITVSPVQYFQIIQVLIKLEDVNDNSPQFAVTPLARSVPENSPVGSSIQLPTATDPDSPVNGIQRYQMLTGSQEFDLHTTTTDDGATEVHLVLKQNLDREKDDFYQVMYAAYNSGTPARSALQTVNLAIQDVNDNRPEFTNKTYYVSIYENLPVSSKVFQVEARDADKGQSGLVVYGFDLNTVTSYGQSFQINNVTGEITLIKSLNFESRPQIQLGITAKDKGPNSLSSRAKVIIKVTDVNDHPPQITVNGVPEGEPVELSEAAVPEDFVAHITVTDPDGGKNGQFNCSMNSPYFRLKQLYPTEYTILAKIKFDREVRMLYDVAIVCEDLGTPSQASTKHIRVIITDENDHAPVFHPPNYRARIEENNQVGQFVVKVTATDYDYLKNGIVEYSLSAEVQHLLAIDPHTGNITAKVKFDFERRKTLGFHVYARDKADEPLSATASVALDVIDTDDEAPYFLSTTYTFEIEESSAENTRIGKVEAADADSPPHNQFMYKLMPTRDSPSFHVDSRTGFIYNRNRLDREKQDVYRVIATAVSLGVPQKTSSALVTIEVKDSNDNAPVITFPHNFNNTVYISNRIALGQTVSRIIAYDIDTGRNAKLSYQAISGNEGGFFKINQTTGVITVQKSLFKKDQQVFGMVIMVTDQGLTIDGRAVQKTDDAILNIVVNRSVAVGENDSIVMNSDNLTIVIIIAAASGIVVVVMIVVIVMLIRRPRRNRDKKYNYMPRLADQQLQQKTSTPIEDGLQRNERRVSFSVDPNHREKKKQAAALSMSTVNPHVQLSLVDGPQQQHNCVKQVSF